MAWLQNLAGHAENLLNKIDQNAATVLNEGTKQNVEDEERILIEGEPYKIETPTKSLKPQSRTTTPEVVPDDNVINNDVDTFTIISETQKAGSVADENGTIKSSQASVSSSSTHNSFVITQEFQNLQSKIARLELENQDTNKQLLNIQHLYSEMRNENSNLQLQLERVNEQLALAQSEKEQYVARAQRILQEKEKLITLKQTTNESENNNILVTYNEELKKELEFQQSKVAELTQKNAKLTNDLESLQMQHQVIQQGLNQSNQSLEKSLANEKRHRLVAEEECAQKAKEYHVKCQEIVKLQGHLTEAQEELAKLKSAFHKRTEYSDNDEFENRIRSLTDTLMLKQNKLETVTTERNALKLQMEKLETEYRRNIAELKRERVRVIDIQEPVDERLLVPNFMRLSPHDAGVTRRVKRAYSTFDAISIRTGIFLRRYPLARVFVFSYMVVLHIWVLTILLWIAPTN